jgi:hypothetical protein
MLRCAVLCCLQAYCCEYGSCWWVGSLLNNTLSALMDQGAELEQAEPVTWLAQQAGLTELVGLKLGKSIHRCCCSAHCC